MTDINPGDLVTLKGMRKVKEKPIQSALVASSVLPLFAADEEVKPPFSEEDYEKEEA